MAVILLIDHQPGIIQQVHDYLLKQYNITGASISTRFIRDLPRSEDGYSIAHLNDKCITDYYPLKDVAKYVDDITDISAIGDVIASDYIKPEVFFTDDLATATNWLSRLPNTFAYDTETTGLAIKDIGNITMHSFSTTAIKSIVLIDSPAIRKSIFDFLTTTNKQVICHNLSFDMRPIYRTTGKFIQNYEDTQLIAQAYLNNADQPLLSLKALAGNLLGDWANSKTSFNLYEDSSAYDNPNLTYVGSNPNYKAYNLPLIYYAGLDVTGTLSIWNKFSTIHPTWESVAMTDLIPIVEPRYHQETPRYFYENVLKPLVRTNIELLETPMPIDMSIIEQIKQEALAQKEPAFQALQNFPVVKKYMSIVKQDLITKFVTPLIQQKANWPTRVYKHNPIDRTFILNYLTGESRDSWKVVDIKQLIPTSAYSQLLQDILDKCITVPNHPLVLEAMATHRSSNQVKLQAKLDNPKQYLNPKQLVINPNAAQQMRGLWKFLGLESDVLTKGKEESFNKDVLKAIYKVSQDESIKQVIKQVLDIAATKNLLSQYIPAYETSNIDGFCYQSMKCPGTKSYRISGAIGKVDKSLDMSIPLAGYGVSMVTQPSITKQAIVAPPGFLIATSDFAGLEGVIGACITHDPNKVAIFNDGLDLHCLNAASFFKEDVERVLGRPVEQTLEFNQYFNEYRKSNKDADKLRSAAKSPNYLLEYGGYPKKLSKDLGCSIATAQAIFDVFHYETFLGTTVYREEYVFPTAQEQGYLHLGLGAIIRTSDIKKDIRTVTNAGYQFWSILTLIALYTVKERIKQAGYQNDIFTYSTIHDSITAYIREDAEIIKWYNDNLIDCMVVDFLHNQEVKLQANLDIGRVYNKCTELPNNASLDVIKQQLSTLN